MNTTLEKLYKDLMTNSPRTVTLDLPAELGSGAIWQTVTRSGVMLTDWQMQYFEDTDVQGKSDRDYFQIHCCLGESVVWTLNGRQVRLQTGEACLYCGHGEMETLQYLKNRKYHFRSLRMPRAFFLEILQRYLTESEIAAYEEPLMCGIPRIRMSPAMEQLLSDMDDAGSSRGGLGYLYLEGKVMQLLAVFLSEILDLEILNSISLNMTEADRAAVRNARRIIDRNPAEAPNREELARQVGLSVSKLTKGFSALFGTSIHSYIIERRLEKASLLLRDGTRSITEIASEVGFSKPSNFSAAFKRRYGVLPKQYRKSTPES